MSAPGWDHLDTGAVDVPARHRDIDMSVLADFDEFDDRRMQPGTEPVDDPFQRGPCLVAVRKVLVRNAAQRIDLLELGAAQGGVEQHVAGSASGPQVGLGSQPREG